MLKRTQDDEVKLQHKASMEVANLRKTSCLRSLKVKNFKGEAIFEQTEGS